MGFDNYYFTIILASVVGFYFLDAIASLLNISSLKNSIPAEFSDSINQEKYKKNQNYTKTTMRFDLLEATFSLVFFMLIWLLGGFCIFDNYLQGLGLSPITTGLICFIIIQVIIGIISLPFSLHRTFSIEERFGFNKTTLKTFFVDLVKSTLLSAVIGLPLIALVLWFFGAFPENGWIWVWIGVSLFTLAMTWLAPVFILPLFNKFVSLEDGELKQSIFSMAKKCDFPLNDLYVMDGSKRSSKSNAFFTGFGKNKRIALFDTLIEQQNVPELTSVLAHEIGHFKKKHITQRLIISLLQIGFIAFLMSRFLYQPKLYEAFGVDRADGSSLPLHFGFMFFFLLFKPISQVISVLGSIWSRKHEFEADEYASKAMEESDSLISALKKLSLENLSHLTPHPLYSFLYHSHPPVVERIRALRKL